VNPATQRFWRVYDGGTNNGSGRPISYDILPLETGHRDIGPSFEPWTFNDIYATTYRACERFVSHNPADSAGGCGSNEDVTDFVSGESLTTNDLVVWFGLTFHHTPRDEDEAYMNAHWNRFRLEPRDWLDVGASNNNPVVNAIANRVDTVAEVVNFAATGTDPDGDSLTFSATGLPPGVSLSAAGGFTGTLTSTGTYNVTVTATDDLGAAGSTTFSWSVVPANACGSCVNFGVDPTESYGGQDIAQNAQVQDVGATLYLQDNTWRRSASTYTVTPNTRVSFEFSSSSEGEIHGIGFDADNTLSQNQIFQLYGTQTYGVQTYNNYTPSGFVSYDIPVGSVYTGTNMRLVFVNDFDAGSGNNSRFRNVRVYEGTANTPPVLTNPGSQSGLVGASVSLQLTATDANGDSLVWSATGLPTGLQVGATGRITGTPAVAGSFNVTVTVRDAANASDSETFVWSVTNPASNGAPVLTNPGNQVSAAGSAVSLSLSATDPDGDSLTYTATGLPAGLSLNATSGLITGTPTGAGLTSVSVTARDPAGLTSTRTFDWAVTANVALGGTASQVSQLQVGLDLSASQAIDGNNNGDFEAFTMAHTDSAAEAWWEIDLGSRYELSRIEIFNRTDCCAESLQNFHVLISDAPFGSTSLATTQAQPGVLDIAPSGIAPPRSILAVGRSGRFVRIQLENTDYLQLAEVEIYGYPASGGSDNFAPLVDNPGAQASVVAQSVSLQVVANDVEGDTLSFSAQGLPTGLDLNSQTGLITGAPTVANNYSVTLEVSDGGNNTFVTFDWLVSADALPTNVAAGGLASQSSTLNIGVDLSAAQAVDGDTNGNFGSDSLSHTDFENQPWWQVDLGTNFTISRVAVFNREDCCAEALRDFYVLVSALPFGNASLATLLNDPNVTAVQVAGQGGRPSDVTINATGRHVRVQLSEAEYLQLAEVQVWGVPAGGGSVNFAPTLTNPGDRSNTLGASASLVLNASDPEGDSLSFSATGLPQGLNIQASTGAISGTLTQGGTFNVVASVSDGNSATSASFVWTVVDPAAPTNLAAAGSARQSSTLDLGLDFSADNAIDGDRGGNFPSNAIAHTDISAESWWEVDLGAVYNLSQVKVFNREDCCAESLANFHVMVSNVPFTGTSVAASLAQPGVTTTFTAGQAARETQIAVNRSGRYIRIQLTTAEYLQLAEVEVLGNPL